MIESSRNREKLRTAEIDINEISKTSLNILASARYKPEDESEHNTDRYGYTQTELQPIMTLRNLSEEEVAQVKEFAEDTMAQGTIDATRQKSIEEKLQDQVSKAIEGKQKMSRY